MLGKSHQIFENIYPQILQIAQIFLEKNLRHLRHLRMRVFQRLIVIYLSRSQKLFEPQRAQYPRAGFAQNAEKKKFSRGKSA
ncbi:MAG: hypothetical protein KDD89_06040, partial [Anaerolineales bacterium]|nr:hypothetical protein [Anaerolineales bacterium]